MTGVRAARPSLRARYAAVLVGTGAARPLVASLVGRIALGTTGLALLLLVRETTGSYATAGAVAAAYAVAFAGAAPQRARRADRSGPRGVLLACAVLHPAALGLLVVLARAGAGGVLLVAAAVLAGATVPPLSGVMRALWAGLVPAQELPTAYSLEAVVVELCFVAGPLLVAGLTAVAGPSVTVLAAGVLVLAGSLGLVAAPALRAVVPHRREPGARGGGPLRSAAVRRLLLVAACFGAGFGALEVAMPAFSERTAGRPGAAGVLLAVWSLGSAAGGLAYGAFHPQVPAARQLPWLVGALTVASALPLLAPGPVVMGGLLVLAGCAIAPYMTVHNVLLGGAAPVGTATEAFSWSGSAIFAGAALGNGLAGVLVEAAGDVAGLAVCAVSGLAALAVVLPARRVLAG